MRPLDPTLLQALVAVAEAGSLSAAAPRLFRSQSAVSEQIRKLEQACGATLFLRGKRGAELTVAGTRLLEHARDILAAHARAEQAMLGIELAGVLRLAITDYFQPRAIPGTLRRIRDAYPQLQVHVAVRKSASIENDRDAGDFDIGLSMRILERRAPRSRPDAGTRRVPLFRERLVWVADSRQPAAGQGPLPLVMLPASCSLQRFVARTLDAHGVPWYLAHSASGVIGLQLALAAGLGISCLNESAVPGDACRVRSVSGVRLPPLPNVEFSLLASQGGEADTLTTQLLDILARELGARPVAP